MLYRCICKSRSFGNGRRGRPGCLHGFAQQAITDSRFSAYPPVTNKADSIEKGQCLPKLYLFCQADFSYRIGTRKAGKAGKVDQTVGYLWHVMKWRHSGSSSDDMLHIKSSLNKIVLGQIFQRHPCRLHARQHDLSAGNVSLEIFQRYIRHNFHPFFIVTRPRLRVDDRIDAEVGYKFIPTPFEFADAVWLVLW